MNASAATVAGHPIAIAHDLLAEQILDVFAREARIERSRLQLDARAEDLGAASLDVALAMFELEDRYDIRLPELPPDAPTPTVGELLQQVLQAIATAATTQAAAAQRAGPAAQAEVASAASLSP